MHTRCKHKSSRGSHARTHAHTHTSMKIKTDIKQYTGTQIHSEQKKKISDGNIALCPWILCRRFHLLSWAAATRLLPVIHFNRLSHTTKERLKKKKKEECDWNTFMLFGLPPQNCNVHTQQRKFAGGMMMTLLTNHLQGERKQTSLERRIWLSRC